MRRESEAPTAPQGNARVDQTASTPLQLNESHERLGEGGCKTRCLWRSARGLAQRARGWLITNVEGGSETRSHFSAVQKDGIQKVALPACMRIYLQIVNPRTNTRWQSGKVWGTNDNRTPGLMSRQSLVKRVRCVAFRPLAEDSRPRKRLTLSCRIAHALSQEVRRH